MQCPSCGKNDTRVVDSRYMEGEVAIRRRRECGGCGYRFSTFERVEVTNLTVIKKSGSREPYKRSKIEKGIRVAAEKRAIPDEKIIEILSRTEAELLGISTSEVQSKQIGKIVMRHLRKLDKVTYIRYASVYKEFDDIDSLEEELHKLIRRRKGSSKS